MNGKITIEMTEEDAQNFVRDLGEIQSFLLDINYLFKLFSSNSGIMVCNKIREKQQDIDEYLQVLKHLTEEINQNKAYRKMSKRKFIVSARNCDYLTFGHQQLDPDSLVRIYQGIKKQLEENPSFQQNIRQEVQKVLSTNQSIKELENRMVALFQYDSLDEEQFPTSMQRFVDKYNTTNYRHTKLKLVKEMEDIRAVTRQRYQSDEDSKKVRLIETTGQSPYYCEAIEGETNLYYVVPIKNIRFSEDTVCQNAYENFFFFDTNNDLDADMGRYVLEKPAIFEKLKDGTYQMVERGRINLLNDVPY